MARTGGREPNEHVSGSFGARAHALVASVVVLAAAAAAAAVQGP